jgi:hypothetical protein
MGPRPNAEFVLRNKSQPGISRIANIIKIGIDNERKVVKSSLAARKE